MRVMLRVYRTHDYDLVALHMSGAIDIGKAIKKAVVARYNGEPVSITPDKSKTLPAEDLPRMITFNVIFRDSDAHGIEEWLEGFRIGYRNCCMKTILRSALSDPGLWLFRDADGAEAILAAREDGEGTSGKGSKAAHSTVKSGKAKSPENKPKRIITAAGDPTDQKGTPVVMPDNQWVDSVAEQSSHPPVGEVMVSDIDDLLNGNGAGGLGVSRDTGIPDNSIPEDPVQDMEDEDEFDAIMMYENMKKNNR